MQWSKTQLRKTRDNMHRAATSLPDDVAYETPELFQPWAVGVAYAFAERVQYGGKLFRCEQAHTSQEGWEPGAVPALWTEVAKPGEIPVWRQPTGEQDAYNLGDKVYYPDKDGDIWISVFDGKNVWIPGVYGWEKEE